MANYELGDLYSQAERDRLRAAFRAEAQATEDEADSPCQCSSLLASDDQPAKGLGDADQD